MAFKFLSVSSIFAVSCDLLISKQLHVPAGRFQPHLDAVHACASVYSSSQSLFSISCREISCVIVWQLSSTGWPWPQPRDFWYGIQVTMFILTSSRLTNRTRDMVVDFRPAHVAIGKPCHRTINPKRRSQETLRPSSVGAKPLGDTNLAHVHLPAI